MYSNITHLIDNKAQGGTECQSVLGSDARVTKIANIWAHDAQLFHLMGAHGLIDYIKNHSFSLEESEAFKLGLSFIPNFMQKCLNEISQNEKSMEAPE